MYFSPNHLDAARLWWQHYGQHSYALRSSWLGQQLGHGGQWHTHLQRANDWGARLRGGRFGR